MSTIILVDGAEPAAPPAGHTTIFASGGTLWTKSAAGVVIPYVATLVESGGPTTLTIGEIGVDEYVRRVGSTLVGGVPAAGGGGSEIVIVEGFTTSDYYQSAVDLIPGATEFSAVWLGIIGPPSTVGQFLCGNQNTSGHGWVIQKSGKVASSTWNLGVAVSDGTGTPGINAISDEDLAAPLLTQATHVALTRAADGTLRMDLNGTPVRLSPESGGTGFTAASGVRFTIGNNPSAWDEPQEFGGCAGVAFITSALTPAQVFAHWRACRNAGFRMTAGAVAWDHRYDLRAPGASFPTQIDDLEGTAHLSRVGTAITATTVEAL